MKNDMGKIIILFLILLFSCTSKVKEGTHITIYNDTEKDIFIMDENVFYKNGDIELFDNGYDIVRNRKCKFLKEDYITRYTIKDIFYSREEYGSKKHMHLYIISANYLNKKKEYIRKYKLYDSVKVYTNQERQEVYYYNGNVLNIEYTEIDDY